MLLWTANVRNYFSLSFSSLPPPPRRRRCSTLIPAILFQGIVSWEAEGQKCIWQTVTRRGAARLISAKSIVPVNAAAQRRVPSPWFVAGNCLSARETSRWNFRPLPLRHRQFRFSPARILKIFLPDPREPTRRNLEGRGFWRIEMWNFPRRFGDFCFFFFLRIEKGGGSKEFRYRCEIMVRLLEDIYGKWL